MVEELRQLMKDVPMYSAHFLSILNEVLIGYRDSLIYLYKGMPLSLSLTSNTRARFVVYSYRVDCWTWRRGWSCGRGWEGRRRGIGGGV